MLNSVNHINLRANHVGYLGAIVVPGTSFTHFENVYYEFRAFALNLYTKILRASPVDKFDDFVFRYIYLYAPPSDGNDTLSYYEYILPYFRDLLASNDITSFVDRLIDVYSAHAYMETRYRLSQSDASEIIDKVFNSLDFTYNKVFINLFETFKDVK